VEDLADAQPLFGTRGRFGIGRFGVSCFGDAVLRNDQ
jgi:hypothetical protein